MSQEESDRARALATVAARIGLDILRTAQALTHVTLHRASGLDPEAAERITLDEIHLLIEALILRLSPIVRAQNLEAVLALIDRIEASRGSARDSEH